jgi:Lrp/AsnC family transcriptional regulator, regulator for asnA, asnC and gidA
MAGTPGTKGASAGRSRGSARGSGSASGSSSSASGSGSGQHGPDIKQAAGRKRETSRAGLDDTAKRIVEQLQQDGRRSYAAIGKAIGLSEAAVRQRVQRLLDSGAMQIVAVTDPMTVGFHRQTMIGIRCGDDLERVADQLAGMDEIDYVVITAGSFDLLIEVVCEDDDQLLEILSRVRSISSVTTTETFVYLKLCKQTYSWGTR